MVGDQRGQFRRDAGVLAQFVGATQPRHQGVQPKIHEASAVSPGVGAGYTGQWLTRPERQRGVEDAQGGAGLPGGAQFLAVADESLEAQGVDGLFRYGELVSALRGFQSGTFRAQGEADAIDVRLHGAHRVAGRLFPQGVDEVVEAALAAFAEQQPDQDRTLQGAAEIQHPLAMATAQWPQQPELVPFHRCCHARSLSGTARGPARPGIPGQPRRSIMTTATMTIMTTTVPRPMYTGFSFFRGAAPLGAAENRVPPKGPFSRRGKGTGTPTLPRAAGAPVPLTSDQRRCAPQWRASSTAAATAR